ncbi:MAG: 16S rRNA (guanine(527)-N(7))-methyltransferase RsmG [Actinobacteria bacterium]|nr:16S rRNA (guanine(527)-N(7))-methyltransferase RsmG [Actinomycetota bacterium]MBM3697922.1 16S rRNA (guanine(527)-N(7))-methyltransferase RsmG [Actinomycetota bacterium]
MTTPEDRIVNRCARCDVTVAPDAAASIARVLEDMLREPQNLSAVKGIDQAVWVHAVDSLSGLRVPAIRDATGIVDIGSGGGFPGLALAAALPAVPVTLVESEQRKADWLCRASAGFPNVRVVAERSETLARDEPAAFPAAVVRAVGPLPVVMELAAPLLAPGGHLVAWRGRRDADDARAAAAAAAELGLGPTPDIDVTPIPGMSRYFSIWEKTADTPDRYPRRPGMATKRPIT